MYAKIASTELEDVNEFVAWAIKGMKAKHGTPKEKIASGKTQDGRDYFINEYPATKTYSQWERVGYVQLPHAVAYIVLSSRDKASYSKDAPGWRKCSRLWSISNRNSINYPLPPYQRRRWLRPPAVLHR